MEMHMLDLSTDQGKHIDARLRSEFIIWLSTVRPDGRPHLVPVWFLWNGSEVLIFSQPNNQKIRNLRKNPNVRLALESFGKGEDVVMFDGKARLAPVHSVAATLPEYAQKYSAMIREMGWTPDSMAAEYSQPIYITPERFLSW
jgi:PPOX class probable F420-dependent enzyme